jgi:glycosyltransferase involved in cell wall biosynthesis
VEGKPWTVAYPAGDRFDPKITFGEIAERARQDGPLRMLFLGNVIPRKGLHVLLKALEHLPRRWTLAVVGSLELDRGYSRRVQRLAESRKLGGSVRFLGPLPDLEVARRLRESQALVVPSFYEGFGIVYLEGMGFGLPGIGTTAGAAGEIITTGRDGFLVEPGSPAALASCLDQLACERERLMEMSMSARQRYLAHPTWEKTAEQVRGFLSNLSPAKPPDAVSGDLHGG